MKIFELTPELYDLQVDWEKRLEKEKDFFIDVLRKRNVKSVLDIGCGTGHHVQLFSNYVERVVGIDPSEDRLGYARENVIRSSNVELVKGGFEDLDRLFTEQFDLIVSLGNTLPILGNRRKVKLALKSTRRRLVKGGLAIFQFLNFEPKVIEENRFYYPKIFEKDGIKYIFLKHFEYGKLKTRVDFLTILLSEENNISDFFVKTSFLCTLRINLFLKMVKNSGFKNIELFGTG
ncbi:MAG: class I SAM-dependent methyltransferase, partial [Actinobacteria bacterium]|nr:class I SAM-dependent methyltransferase [Actinomycetota bacterium]